MAIVHVENPARSRLEADELSLGVGIRVARTVDIALMMKSAGMDWLFIDAEHGCLDIETIAQLSVAALGVGISPIVRVPNGDMRTAARALDGGALGIVVPQVQSAQEAREIVRQLRYAPMGERGVTGMQPQFGYMPIELGAATAELNRSILLVVMLESPLAISRSDEIAAVPGIDVVMVGTNDLAMSLGKPGQFGDPQVGEAYETVVAACRKHGKWAGSGGLGDPAHFKRYIDLGVRFFLAGQDLGFLMGGARERSRSLRSMSPDKQSLEKPLLRMGE
jgi:2-keto-3-deoxy-L-rhamnonate aldolase RhmA